MKPKSFDANMDPSTATVKMAVETAAKIEGAASLASSCTPVSAKNMDEPHRTIPKATAPTTSDVYAASVRADLSIPD
eukprot:CAMPEP_0198151516 /NCGR_PEP_ID=MMETSP1443-20131203/55826_1 /TAXON_ID=186043 /ORGANISM="Entomoneis sp., Strain CCMP2396" /LENGTH=76 /DNA_ID=CAMNT_0043817203 /DNA_START=54 /DNA_END=281 /DNA_ORIENTATION=-